MLGTRIGNDAANEFLYNLATPGVLIEQRTQFEDVRAAVVALMEAGQPISFRLKTYNHMVLNAEKTHIEKWIVIYRYITVSKANNI